MEEQSSIFTDETSVQKGNENKERLVVEITDSIQKISSEWETLKNSDAEYFDKAKVLVEEGVADDKVGRKEQLLDLINYRKNNVNESNSDSSMYRISARTLDENINFFLVNVTSTEDAEKMTALADEFERRIVGIISDLDWNRDEIGKLRRQVPAQSYDFYGYDSQRTTEKLEEIAATAKQTDEVQTGRIKDAIFVIKNDIQEIVKIRLADIKKTPKEEVATIV